ncbi:hypothetical protein EV198_1142 [Roseivirga ehrenbergii]|uniref:Porin n=1 Tax=Roseivirga ehrenbergii (strain DSM 102268 / JCM 13514 / KCTC 12282 / NCIMB 14502 / KMM 6017) TaxID=279360 RepID=A0A150X6S7_ROSEK|nr:hypothetical protein [Roseivirga ehrenbergii]KYG74396.1 hypothetical protein MB14_04075 [Roseivirga ehrenbergii]TCL14302.1 hypothetical protein EV198_1142 [Roseivirga ehrenbergii]
MKNFKMTFLALFLFSSVASFAQVDLRSPLQYRRDAGKKGINVFETSKADTVIFEGINVRVGGDFALQFQGLSHENSIVGDPLVDLASNFSLPTANLNLDVQLADGMRLHLRTYLSSRHHTESYVKGGYLQMDKLDFIKEGFLSELMKIATIRVGMDQINYGDAQFRRSDNAMTIYNPFVSNYIMDAFTTEPFFEVTLQPSDFILVAGVTNGRLNQSPVKGDDGMVIYSKVGWDKQMNDDLRLRLTGSLYSSSDKSTRDYIYGGDRAGGRYYSTLATVANGGSDFDPRFNPGFGYQTAIQFNPFVKFKGLEFFGVMEFVNNGNDAVGGSFTQVGLEGLYRFGMNEQWYFGGRYNNVSGEKSDVASTNEISRMNLGGGWFMTNNVLVKLEYVNQEYSGAGFANSRFQDGKFNGVVLEAAISF